MSKCMEEIKRVIAYRESIIGPAGGKVLALCLSSRRNMCIHPRINSEGMTYSMVFSLPVIVTQFCR